MISQWQEPSENPVFSFSVHSSLPLCCFHDVPEKFLMVSMELYFDNVDASSLFYTYERIKVLELAITVCFNSFIHSANT